MHMSSSEHVSPAVNGSHGTWFLGRPKTEDACDPHGKHHGRHGCRDQRYRGTWFLGRKHP